MKSDKKFSIWYIAPVLTVSFSILISAIMLIASQQMPAQCLLQTKGGYPAKPEYAIDLGSGAKVFYKAPFFLTWQGISPDESYTLYEKTPNQPDNSTKSLVLRNNTTKQFQEITKADKTMGFLPPTWSPNGDYFAIQELGPISGQLTGMILVSNRDGTISHTVSAVDRQTSMAWSDDSAYLVYNDTNSLSALSIPDFQVTKIADNNASSSQVYGGWIAHTHKVIYEFEMFNQQDAFAYLYIYDVDKRSTEAIPFADQPQSWFSSSISPDGHYLAASRTAGQSLNLWRIFDISHDGYFTELGSVTMNDSRRYWWTLDNHTFIYISDKNSPLMAFSTQNNQDKPVIEDNIGLPQLSPDGKNLLVQRKQPNNRVSLNLYSLEDNALHELESGLINWNSKNGALPVGWVDNETILTTKQIGNTFEVDLLNIETEKTVPLATELPSAPYVVHSIIDDSKIYILWSAAGGQGLALYDIPAKTTTFYHVDTTYPNTDITYFRAIPSPDKHFVALFFRELNNFSLQLASTDRPSPILLYRGLYSGIFGSVFWLNDSSSLFFSLYSGPTELIRNDGTMIATYPQKNPNDIGWSSCSDYLPQF